MDDVIQARDFGKVARSDNTIVLADISMVEVRYNTSTGLNNNLYRDFYRIIN